MQEINLYDLLRYYARNWLLLLSALFVGAIIGLTYTSFIQTALYKSDATMLVVGARTSSTDTTINNNYTELFKSRLVLDGTIKQQGYSGDYEQLLARTTATNDKNTDVIKVSIADTEPEKSQQLLSAAAEAFKAQASKIYGSNNIKTVDNATLPTKPYNVNVVTQVGLAMAAAFFLAIIVLFFIYDYATSYKGTGSEVTSKPAKKKSASKQASVQQQRVEKKRNSYVGGIFRRLGVLFAGEPEKPESAGKKS